jgi:hypothetical protein
MQIRIEGRDLPGRSCASGPNFPGYENIHVGVQRRARPSEHLDLRFSYFLADVDPRVLAEAAKSGVLTARLGLTDPKGRPVCAWIKPPHIEWSAESNLPPSRIR